MRTRTHYLTLLLMLTALCAFTPLAFANDGDWNETTTPQWWWKYVLPGDGSVREVAVVAVDVVQVRSDRAGYVAHRVTFTLVNKGKETYRGGHTFKMEHGLSEPIPEPRKCPDPLPWKPVTWTTLAKGLLPTLGAGQGVRIGGIAYTPEKAKYDNFATLTVGM